MSDQDLESRVFPSGRTVANCRKDAKRLVKLRGISHHEALDEVARTNGSALPWDRAVTSLPQRQNSPYPLLTRQDIKLILDQHPSLNHFGFGLSSDSQRKLTITQQAEKLAAERQRLIDAVDECNKASRYLSFLEKRKTINGRSSSYGLKHRVEHLMKALPEVEHHYVANGSFIVAAIHHGFDIERVRPGSPNAFINFSSRSPVIQWADLNSRRQFLSHSELQKLEKLKQKLGIPEKKVPEDWLSKGM